jgi:signal transduction histidine kinase
VADTSVKGFNEYGELVGVIGILQDVTERKQALFDRERLIAELGTRNAELERYSYTLSHELKTPLVTLAAYSEALEKDMSMGHTERVKSDLARIRRATDKMHKMIKELLELSRIGRIINTPQDVPFDEIVRDGLSAVEGHIDEKKVQIEIEPNLPMIRGDRIRLVEVIQNLVDNAIKYMGDQPEPRISIGTNGRDENGYPTFFVKDNGMGIDKGYHHRVFGMFEKLNPQSEGTGIGLALIKRIVEVHGGKIWVESDGPGTGSTFLFTLAEKS